MLLFPALLVWSGILIWRGFHNKLLTWPQLGTLLFIVGNILVIVITTNLLSSFEKQSLSVPDGLSILNSARTLVQQIFRRNPK